MIKADTLQPASRYRVNVPYRARVQPYRSVKQFKVTGLKQHYGTLLNTEEPVESALTSGVWRQQMRLGLFYDRHFHAGIVLPDATTAGINKVPTSDV